MKAKTIFLILFICALSGCGSRQARLFETWGERPIIRAPLSLADAKKAISEEYKANEENVELKFESALQPRFPKMAFLEKREGWVKLEVFLNLDGSVKSVKVLDSSPKNVFEQTSIKAVKQWNWKLKPGFKHALPIYFFTEFKIDNSPRGKTKEAN